MDHAVQPPDVLELCGIRTSEPNMRGILDTIRRFAQLDSPVLVNGETGTGKELVARALHALSARQHRPLVVIDCAVLPDSLAESELFGHERGAFTGAERAYPGRIEMAAGGTLFLDEVNSLSLAIQGKLLRFLEQGQLQRLGQQRSISVDARLIAASNVPLEHCVRSGRMRADFFYRLNVLTIDLPPLRERINDVPLLVHQFFDEDPLPRRLGIRSVSREVMSQLRAMPWPGNVRELRNLLRRSVVLGAVDGVVRRLDIVPDVMPPLPLGPEKPPSTISLAFRKWMRQREQEYLAGLVEKYATVGQQATAAGLPERTLYRKLKSFGLRTSPLPARRVERGVRLPRTARPQTIVAPNAGLTTGDGTNQYVLGDRDLTLIDAAPLVDVNARRLISTLRGDGRRLGRVLLTHLHTDHSGGAPALRRTDHATVAAHAQHAHSFVEREALAPDQLLADGDEIPYEKGRLRVLHTPGHESGHCCYYEPESRWLFTGDLINGIGMVVIAPPEGDVDACLTSLRRLLDLELDMLFPGHGPAVDRPHARIAQEINDILLRERRILALVASGHHTVSRIVDDLYVDLHPALRPSAMFTVHAHLHKLVTERAVVEEPPDRFRLQA
jgi:transcriptional regulator with AAA-type ATPase domain/glyoxylase-like metal-dependent hydrolase (beta-lactamase superfamily II)